MKSNARLREDYKQNGEYSRDDKKSQASLQQLQQSREKQDDSETRVSEKEKIIEENIKLKTRIYELANELEEIVEKDKVRKRKLGSINVSDQDETLRQKKAELKKQQLQILQMKNKIAKMKQHLENVYNNRSILNKEEQLRALKEELRLLEDEKSGLLKIKREQAKSLQQLQSEEQYSQKIEELKKQLAKVKEQSRTINQKVLESQRVLRKNHEQYITKQEKIKQLQNKLASSKERAKNRRPIQTVTPEMIVNLEEEIGVMEQQRREDQKMWQQRIRAIDAEYEQKKLEEQKKLLILKEKQKQYRLNQLKIKELRKLVRHNLASESKKKEDIDMSEFRHKRNIKYLDK